MDSSLPESATLPAGGVKIGRLCPNKLAGKIIRAVEKRQKELILPKSARWLFALTQISPRLGDWIIKRKSNRN